MTPRWARRRCGRRRPASCAPATSSWPTREPASTAWPRTASPLDVTFVGQPLWASIGYTLPALLGACTAQPGRRGVLLIGDGAAQLTVQELATVLQQRVPAVVVVVDNDGYTVERAIHGPDEPYNDITRWDWTRAPAFFGAGDDGRAAASRVRTVGELRAAFTDAAGHPERLTLIQAVVPRDDVPELLDTLTRALGRAAPTAALEP